MYVILVETEREFSIEFLRDLFVRQIEAHQIQTQDPQQDYVLLAQRLMVMREDGVSQIVKVALTRFAVIALPFALALV